MATFTAHAALGAGTMGAAVRALGGKPWQVNVATIYGAFFGMGPDVIDYIGSVFGWCARWEWYSIFHAFKPWWMIVIGTVPWLEHLTLDLAFHSGPPGWNWWPTLAWLEISMWLVAGGLFWYAYRQPKQLK